MQWRDASQFRAVLRNGNVIVETTPLPIQRGDDQAYVNAA
jgi:hypothetical protein